MVQFVKYAEYSNDMERLTKEILKEIPKQMLEYFSSKKIKPNPVDKNK